MRWHAFSHFQVPSPCWYLNHPEGVRHCPSDSYFVCLFLFHGCPWEMLRGGLPPIGARHSVSQELGPWKEVCQAHLSAHREPPAHCPGSAHLEPSKSSRCGSGAFITVHPPRFSHTWNLAKSVLFRKRLSPETGRLRGQPEGLAKKKTMKRTDWK